jgi:hypothetical protein
MSSLPTSGIVAKVGRIGFTTNIPVEILFAAGKIPIDLY